MEDDFEFGERDEVKFGKRGLASMWRTQHSCHNLYKFKLKILLCTRSSSGIYHRQFFLEDKIYVLQEYFHLQTLLTRNDVVTAVQDWGTCHHCGLSTTTRFLQATTLSTSTPYPSLLPGFRTTFYAQNSDLVAWSWQSTLL